MGADGSGQTRLTRGADQESPVAWLPDGRVVYASFHGDQPLPHWYLIDAAALACAAFRSCKERATRSTGWPPPDERTADAGENDEGGSSERAD